MKAYIFPTIVMIAALVLATGAALFTVLGFRELFEPSIKITYMAASIEFGKIIAVSALYRFRDSLGWITKCLLSILVIIAMIVTSMGVYGYLSSSYQKDSMAITQNGAKIELVDKRYASLEARLEGMDAQIQNVPENYVTKRIELVGTFKPERDSIITEMDELSDTKLELALDRIDKETEFGAIIVLSRSVSWLNANDAMLYFILAVIFIFDPMAIALTYAANVGYDGASNSKRKRINDDFVHSMENHPNALASVVATLDDISAQLEELKTPTANSRSSVIDSMRTKKT